MGRPRHNLVNKRFGNLVVSEYAEKRGRGLGWFCKCDCGNEIVVQSGNLIAGRTKSCGCRKLLRGSRNPSYIHGRTLTPEYRAYQSAKTRCTNPNVTCFPEYGGRGIKFLFSSFDQWFAELGPRPSPKHSVDRIKNDLSYAPGNVRWATKKEQVHNRKREYGLSGC